MARGVAPCGRRPASASSSRAAAAIATAVPVVNEGKAMPRDSAAARRQQEALRGRALAWLGAAALLLMATPAAANCRLAAALAERRHGIPAGLLQAIAQVETGNQPWSLNAAGEPRLHPTRAAALADLRLLLAQGVRPLDVGCLQVSLYHHPRAFGSPEQALDPVENANYAGSFLRRLFDQAGDWRLAIARYHSADSTRGAAYRAQVEAVRLPDLVLARPAFTPAEARARAVLALEMRLAALGHRRVPPPSLPRPVPLPPLIEYR